MGRMSVATVKSPEFINISSISPFASKCEIKVLYLGQNRNGSFIDKQVAESMAQTLPGCPIVGYYSEDKEDFRDHGEQMIIDGDGIKFKCQTVPYGFVAPDAKVWFQEFQDTDEFGNSVIRNYLMTEGYLWTEQYEEALKVINEGRPQSMELDTKTLKGHWSTDNNSGIDFFIINDAIFSKLCILGEDVEPCFEGASVTAPDVSSTFSKNEEFTKTLYTMMNQLKELTFSLNNEGGNTMPTNEEFVAAEGAETVEATVEAPVVEEPAVEEGTSAAEDENTEKNSEMQGKDDLEDSLENQNNTEEFAKKDDEEEEKSDDSDSDDETEEDDEKKEKTSKNSLEERYALLETELKELKDQYTALESEKEALVKFKEEVEDKQKLDLINSFYMLSDEDKKEVLDNRSKYTLDDIKKNLSVICVDKKVNFNLEEEKDNNSSATTFNLEDAGEATLPAWLKAVEERRNAEN